MPSSIFLVLRRMRAPLLTVIVVYAISITGLVVIPGVDPAGNRQPLDFLHAFYVISYTATTIGFGEIPHAFTPAQRLWVTACIYMTVVAWSFAFVKMLALFQDRWFLQAIAEQRFKFRVRRLAEPFYLVCGYGQSGSLVCRALDDLGRQFVVLDADAARLAELELADYRSEAPALVADASNPSTLNLAGLLHPRCAAVLALTGNDRVNVVIAAASHLLRPALPVISRAQGQAAAEELALFRTARIIDPNAIFADYLCLAIRSPGSYQLVAWLTDMPGTTLGPQSEPPAGPWLICGEDEFAERITRTLHARGLSVRAVPLSSDGRSLSSSAVHPEGHWVEGITGLIAATDDDSRNLSIAAAARAIRKDIFVVLRQNRRATGVLSQAFAPDITVYAPEIVLHACLAQLNTPLLPRFLRIVEEQDDAWADAIVNKLRTKITLQVPNVWTVELTRDASPAAFERAQRSRSGVRVDHLVRDPADRDRHLPCVPLLIDRNGTDIVMPALETVLQSADRILFAGTRESCDRQELLLQNVNALEYVCEGRHVPVAWVWRLLARINRPA
jgi:Trk K+ transport system NAD-binding subunit